MKRYLLLTALLITSLSLSGCSDRQTYKRTRLYMGTIAEFNIASPGNMSGKVKEACDLAESRIAGLDKMLSTFDSSSVVWDINSDEEKVSVKVPTELFLLVERAKELYNLTQGAFDITVQPLTDVWGFGPQKTKNPDIVTIKEALSYVGLDKIELDDLSGSLKFKNPKVKIDFGGFAKGYAVDAAVRILKQNSISSGIVNIGGDLYCMGTNFHGKKWAIGIRDPERPGKNMAILEVKDKAIATSGSYENFYIYGNKRLSHIIDPRTGNTVSNDIESVTIIADDCATADALATAVFVLGKRNGLSLIEKLPGIECLLVVGTGEEREIIMSSGIKGYLKEYEA